jgi:peptidyl-prolyl cis-trans isomerase SurA
LRRWFVAAPLAGALLALPASGGEVVDGIAAQVGSEIVLVSEVLQLAAPVEERMRAEGASEAEVQRLRATVLDRLIERRLVALVVRRAELSATDAEVDQTLGTIAQQNGFTLDQLRASVEAQGLPWVAYRERMRGEIEHAKVMNGMVAARVRVDDEELRAAYESRFADQPEGGEEVHLRQLVAGLEAGSAEARRTACAGVQGALARIRAGEDFAELARELSEANPERGGDIGWVHVASLAGWMAPVVSSLDPGGTSDVIETSFGCALLHLVERRVYEPVSFEQARDRLRQELFDERMEAEYRRFIDKIRAQTYVERKGVYAQAPPALPAIRPGEEDGGS